MAAKEKEYQRLPGRGIRRYAVVSAGRTHLWLGKDHLLSIDAQWYTEEYRRFYFRDIQAVVIRKTHGGKITNAVLGGFTLLPLVAAIATGGDAGVFWWIVAGFFGLILLINTLYGPTCITHMRTAVQTEELSSLRRLRRANKVLARLRPLIAAAQGELPVAEIPARMEQLARPGATAVATAPAVAASIPETFQPPDAPPAG